MCGAGVQASQGHQFPALPSHFHFPVTQTKTNESHSCPRDTIRDENIENADMNHSAELELTRP